MDGIPISEEPEARKSATQILGDELFQVRKQSSDLGRAKVKLASPQIVMIVTKSLEAQFVIFARQLSLFLITRARKCSAGGLSVLVDIKLKTNATFQVLLDQYPELSSKIAYWTPEYCANNHAKIDFILTLGGDGTILYTAWLFQHSQVPPIIPFHLGSLGFLTVFKISDITRVLDMALGCSSIGHGVCLNMRVRLACTIWRKSSSAVKLPKVKTLLVNQSLVTLSVSQGLVSDGNEAAPLRRSSTDESFAGPVTYIPGQTFHIINDVVVDRGPSAYMSQLELFVDNVHLTTSQADGIVVATPTGSTAYSLAAGGSLVHPLVSAFLVTPVCPHSLSFRPMLLPDSAELKIQVPLKSRNTAWASFDGRHRVELTQGDYICITMSKYPVPTVCMRGQGTDWFESLRRCLHWNERRPQKPFGDVDVEIDESKLRPDDSSLEALAQQLFED